MTALLNIFVCLVTFFCVSIAGASALHVARDVRQADPISGLRWQRVADPNHPAAPPRLTLVRGADTVLSGHRELRRAALCVRAGDHVLVHGKDAGPSTFLLEAMALESGACGDRVRVRVAVTGALAEMSVLGSGVGVLSDRAVAWR
ncbi:MAG TPA: hypothetical protein VE109_00635 [Acidobacteriaceae bacterium]|nr:hypothetical protein [Acidobacteriaceae bacterium]